MDLAVKCEILHLLADHLAIFLKYQAVKLLIVQMRLRWTTAQARAMTSHFYCFYSAKRQQKRKITSSLSYQSDPRFVTETLVFNESPTSTVEKCE